MFRSGKASWETFSLWKQERSSGGVTRNVKALLAVFVSSYRQHNMIFVCASQLVYWCSGSFLRSFLKKMPWLFLSPLIFTSRSSYLCTQRKKMLDVSAVSLLNNITCGLTCCAAACGTCFDLSLGAATYTSCLKCCSKSDLKNNIQVVFQKSYWVHINFTNRQKDHHVGTRLVFIEMTKWFIILVFSFLFI